MNEPEHRPSAAQIIPNAVGRLDDVVDAIRSRDLDRAANLLDAELARLEAKREQIRNDLGKVEKAISEVNHFRFKFRSEEEWERVRVACGGGAKSAEDGIAPVGAFTILRHSQMFRRSQKGDSYDGK